MGLIYHFDVIPIFGNIARLPGLTPVLNREQSVQFRRLRCHVDHSNEIQRNNSSFCGEAVNLPRKVLPRESPPWAYVRARKS